MPSMRYADRSDVARMARCCKPVVDGCPDPAALDGRIFAPMVAGDHQKQAITARNRLVQGTVDGGPGRIEVHSMKIKDPVGFDPAAAKLLVPAAIERLFMDRDGPWLSGRRRFCCRFGGLRSWSDLLRRLTAFGSQPIARQRPDRCCDLLPKFGLFRAERAHASQRSWARGSALPRLLTFRQRSLRHRRRRPNRYRTGWGP